MTCAGIVTYYRPSRQLEHANLSPLKVRRRLWPRLAALSGPGRRPPPWRFMFMAREGSCRLTVTDARAGGAGPRIERTTDQPMASL